MTDGTAEYGRRLRDLEAFAFRTRNTLTGHDEQPATAGERQHPAPGTTGPNAVERRLDTIERILYALARAQGLDPTTTE